MSPCVWECRAFLYAGAYLGERRHAGDLAAVITFFVMLHATGYLGRPQVPPIVLAQLRTAAVLSCVQRNVLRISWRNQALPVSAAFQKKAVSFL